MLLGDFHIHTTWSDGRHSLPEVVDLFGRSGHDVIAITDHVVNSDSLPRKGGPSAAALRDEGEVGRLPRRDRAGGAPRLGHLPDARPPRRRADAERLHGRQVGARPRPRPRRLRLRRRTRRGDAHPRPRRRSHHRRVPPERAVGLVREHVLPLEPARTTSRVSSTSGSSPAGGISSPRSARPASPSSATATSTAPRTCGPGRRSSTARSAPRRSSPRSGREKGLGLTRLLAPAPTPPSAPRARAVRGPPRLREGLGMTPAALLLAAFALAGLVITTLPVVLLVAPEGEAPPFPPRPARAGRSAFFPAGRFHGGPAAALHP